MKKILTLTLILTSLSVFAQTEKGKQFVGGSADISVSYTGKNSGFNLGVSPSYGVFVVRGFVMGVRYTFGISSSKNYDNNKKEYTTTTSFNSSIGPIFRYYIGKKQLKGVITFNPNYLTTVTLRKTSVSGNNGFNIYGLAGIAYFLNDHLSIETGLYASATGYLKVTPTLRIGVSVGLFVFLDKKKKEEALPVAP